MSLIDTYIAIITYIGLKVDNNGYVLYPDDKPATMRDKPIALPIPGILKRPAIERIIFHPLLEEINKGESDILKYIKDGINIRLNVIFSTIALSLLRVAASPELHSKLQGDQLDMLLSITDVDAKTISVFTSIMMKAMRSNAEKAFINIYLKRGGYARGIRYSRVGIVTFSLLEQLEKNEDLYGVKIRKSDRAMLINLYKVIFPDIQLEAYNVGSNTYVAPFLDALLSTSKAITDVYNQIIEDYKDHIQESELVYSHCDWAEPFTHLEDFNLEIKRIPMQDGNQGSIDLPNNPKSPSVAPVEQTMRSLPAKGVVTMQEMRQKMQGTQPTPFPGVVPQWQPQPAKRPFGGTAFGQQQFTPPQYPTQPQYPPWNNNGPINI